MRTRNAVPFAVSIEIHCPHCNALVPAPDGSESMTVQDAKDVLDGKTILCPGCDERVRMLWQDKVRT